MTAVDSLGRGARFFVFLAAVGFAAIVLVGPVVALLSVVVSLVISVVGVLLPFALVGLLIYIPYQVVTNGPGPAWANIRAKVGYAVGSVALILARVTRLCARLVRTGLTYLGLVRPVARTVTEAAANASAKAVDVGVKVVDAAKVYGPRVAGVCADGARRAAHRSEEVLAAAVDEGRAVCTRTWPWARFLGGLVLEVIGGAVVGGLLLGVGGIESRRVDECVALGAAGGAAVGLIVGVLRGRPQAQACPEEACPASAR